MLNKQDRAEHLRGLNPTKHKEIENTSMFSEERHCKCLLTKTFCEQKMSVLMSAYAVNTGKCSLQIRPQQNTDNSMNSTSTSQVKIKRASIISHLLFPFQWDTFCQSGLNRGLKPGVPIYVIEKKKYCYALLGCDIIMTGTDILKEPTALKMEVCTWDVLLSSQYLQYSSAMYYHSLIYEIVLIILTYAQICKQASFVCIVQESPS